MLNRVVLIGRLTKDPELRYTNSGTAVANFTLAVDRMRANQNGEKETDFIPIVVWQKQAEICAQYLHKGRQAAVDGRLQIRSFENREGQRVRVAEVVAESVRFLDHGDSNQSNGQGNGNYQNQSNGNNQNRGNGSYQNQGNGNNQNQGNGSYQGNPNNGNPQSGGRYDYDPFADDSQTIDISDDDLPF